MSAILALKFAWGVHFELASWNCELYDLVIDLLQYETAWIRVRCCLTLRPVRETEKR